LQSTEVTNDQLPTVSVIMSMRNSASTVDAAIRSVRLQTHRDWELIVIDDGSVDQSSAIVEGFHDERIRLVRETGSAGLATRLNQAVALSRCEFIARMDADVICFPERLSPTGRAVVRGSRARSYRVRRERRRRKVTLQNPYAVLT
jgi:glycosyltransferase involved in cell wall biosynthesis